MRGSLVTGRLNIPAALLDKSVTSAVRSWQKVSSIHTHTGLWVGRPTAFRCTILGEETHYLENSYKGFKWEEGEVAALRDHNAIEKGGEKQITITAKQAAGLTGLSLEA